MGRISLHALPEMFKDFAERQEKQHKQTTKLLKEILQEMKSK